MAMDPVCKMNVDPPRAAELAFGLTGSRMILVSKPVHQNLRMGRTLQRFDQPRLELRGNDRQPNRHVEPRRCR